MEHKFSFRRALSLIVVLAMVLSTAAVFALTASAEDATIGLDRANHYDWTQKDFQSDSYTPTAASAGEVLVAASEDATALVGGRFGGNYFTWWYAILAEFDAAIDGRAAVHTGRVLVITRLSLLGLSGIPVKGKCRHIEGFTERFLVGFVFFGGLKLVEHKEVGTEAELVALLLHGALRIGNGVSVRVLY